MHASIDRIRAANQSFNEGPGPYMLSIVLIVVGAMLYLTTETRLWSVVVAFGAGLLAGKVIDSIRSR